MHDSPKYSYTHLRRRAIFLHNNVDFLINSGFSYRRGRGFTDIQFLTVRKKYGRISRCSESDFFFHLPSSLIEIDLEFVKLKTTDYVSGLQDGLTPYIGNHRTTTIKPAARSKISITVYATESWTKAECGLKSPANCQQTAYLKICTKWRRELSQLSNGRNENRKFPTPNHRWRNTSVLLDLLGLVRVR